MAVIDELLIGLGFEYSDEDLEKFKGGVDSTIGLVTKLASAVGVAVTAITALTVKSTAATDKQGKFAAEIGVAVGELDAMQFAAERVGDSADGLAAGLKRLSIRAGAATRDTGAGKRAFDDMGLSITDTNGEVKNTIDLLFEVSELMVGMSKAEQMDLADKIGMRDSIKILQAGPDAIRELMDEAKALGVTTEEDTIIAAEFQDALTDLWAITKDISRTISRAFAPALTSILSLFKEWWKANGDIIRTNLPIFIEWTVRALKILLILLGTLIAFKLAAYIFAAAKAFKAASVAAWLFNAALIAIPILIAAGIALFIGLLEDAKTFFDGGESLIGDLIKAFPEWTEEIHMAAAALAVVADWIGQIVDGWKLLADLAGKFSMTNVKEVVGNLPGFLAESVGISADTTSGSRMSMSDFANGGDGGGATSNQTINVTLKPDELKSMISGNANLQQQTRVDLSTGVDQ